MAKGKLVKFAEIGTFSNTFQNFDWDRPMLVNHEGKEVDLKGKWQSSVFKNDHPIVLELACGYGEYTLGLSQLFNQKNFIGIDFKGNRIWQGAKYAIDHQLGNAAFLRTRIELLKHFFEAGEVSEIWIIFPDPFLRKKRAGNRLTSPRFLPIYHHILKKDGFIHLKTDSGPLYEYTLETLEAEKATILEDCHDIYGTKRADEVLSIETRYERMHLLKGKTIKYVRFQLGDEYLSKNEVSSSLK